MKVLFQSRVDLYNPRGGDTMQIENTKSAIEKADSSVKIDIVPEVKVKDIEKYDIVHLFNLDWICETYPQAKLAKKHKKPLVLSAIHHSEDEVKIYEKKARYDIRRVYNALIPSQALRDMGKNIYRSFFNRKKISPAFIQLIGGIRRQQRKVLEMSDVVFVQTAQEAEDIIKDFKFNNLKWIKVVNGVAVDIFKSPDKKKFQNLSKEKFGVNIRGKKLLLNVGRIEPRKNQLKLIEVFKMLKNQQNEEDWNLAFIGALGKNSIEYNYRFLHEIKKHTNILFFGSQPQEIVASAMAQSGIYVHPSWFETTGLVSIEAALAGMTVVASGDRVKEYLGNDAFYCDPSSAESILNAILEADVSDADTDLRKRIVNEFIWEKTAEQTINVYKNLLKS